MSVFNSIPPIINKYHLIEWLKTNYSNFKKKNITLIKLHSERDSNFLLRINLQSTYIIKISNSLESNELLNLQDFVLNELKTRKSVKNLIPETIHKSIKIYKDQIGRECRVRILSYIDGKLYSKIQSTRELEFSLGSFLGNLSRELQSINHPSSFRNFEWDPSNIEWIEQDLKLFQFKQKKIITKNLYEFKKFIKNNKNNLRYGLTHGDPNDYNLVVKNKKIVGLLDYGDMIFAPVINDLAICLAYALMNKDDLYTTLKNVILSFHKNFQITFDEIFSLMTIVKSRLTITVVMAEKQRIKFPDNKYLTISLKEAWLLLNKLDKINPYIFIYLIRDICGYQITINYKKVINFLIKNKFENILETNLNKINKSIIKLDSKSIFSKKYKDYPKKNINIINSYLKKNNSEIGVGLYGEKRSVYKGLNYLSLLNAKTRRDIHIGIDIFTKSGTNIIAPLDGKIIILKNNFSNYDYGPTVILEHSINKQIKFFTLYGHLYKKCLTNLSIGQKVKKGDFLAKVGNFQVNGNWPPHLHFQIIIDLMDEKENFPGVVESIIQSMWMKVSPDPNLILKIPNSFFKANDKTTNLISKRKLLISNNISISYKNPIQIVESKAQYIYDHKGKQYLDCINNISHVGHCHPRVQNALLDQNSKFNTNTRYLYKIMNVYSEKLLSKFPKKLDTVFFVCSGSEANDLAYRIAQTYTRSKDVLVMNNAYHGHTSSLIDLSPYKFNGKGGEGQKSHVHIAEMPDGIRGKWLYTDPEWIHKNIYQVKNLIDNIRHNNKRLSCFFVESILGCGGQIILPKDYLKDIFKIIKKNNALCIVDEVQTGFARIGSKFWEFEEHGVIPDIVTLGKPMGNGHPLAAVVTTKEIAKVFNNGMEYFNSFGGNPVSCAVGNTVLDIIEDENLQLHSYNTGKYLLNLLQKIKIQYSDYISEVRGRGLFLGIDIINYNNLKPNSKLATYLINHMRNKGILLSIDGPNNNVVKIKPPLPFDKNDCDYLCYELNQFLKKI